MLVFLACYFGGNAIRGAVEISRGRAGLSSPLRVQLGPEEGWWGDRGL